MRISKMLWLFLLFPLIALGQGVPSNGLSATPMMIVGTWYQYGTTINQTQFRQLIDAVASDGLSTAGYKIVVLEEPFTTLSGSTLLLNTTYFPTDTWATLAAYIHSKGLLFGVYTSPGLTTCAGNPGSYGREAAFANQWAAAGVDYVENDWCSAGAVYPQTAAGAEAAYTIMGNALQATGRPIYYMAFVYGLYDSPTWFADTGANAVRVSYDIAAKWDSGTATNNLGVHQIGFLSLNGAWNPVTSGPGHYQFGDQLIMGCGTCTISAGTLTADEAKTQMGMWSLRASPLMIGSDVVNASLATLSILTNAEVIAIDQDPLGQQATNAARKICGVSYCETWKKPLSGNRWAVGLFNLDNSTQTYTVTFSGLGLAQSTYAVRDVWGASNLGNMTGYSVTLPPHASALLLLRPANGGTSNPWFSSIP